MRQPPNIYVRRRLAAGGVLAAFLLLVVLSLRACGGDGDSAGAVATAPKPLVAQLPGGGRTIFPGKRVVAFYGAPQSERLGILGIGSPERAAKRLRRVASAYKTAGKRPVLLAFELISTIANAHPGDDGQYRTHQTDAVIERYLLAARKAKALLLLDVQPGRGDFLSEAQRLQRWLLEPDVGLALDPEWHVADGEVPGQSIGSVTAEQVNEVATYVSNIVGKHDLPQKLFVIHQFTDDMIRNKELVARPPGLAITMNVDGFGNPANKISKYKGFTSSESATFHNGFKLFFEEDTDLMSHKEVLALRPQPDLVVYE